MNKNILLCVTGGIACYKAITLASLLKKNGYDVKVAMTEGAMKFVTPLMFQSITKNAVYTDVFSDDDPEMIAHVDLSKWADLIVVAPASANTIARIAYGMADTTVTAAVLAKDSDVFIAPSMNTRMYKNDITQHNIKKLRKYGFTIIKPTSGMLACGDLGDGRLPEPEDIFEAIEQHFEKNMVFVGKKILITAGPTIEAIDPFRFISNYSSGKMGYALAEAARDMGAEVTLISGKCYLDKPPNVDFFGVKNANEMYRMTLDNFEKNDVLIMSAAVSDYTPIQFSEKKIKKSGDEYNLSLTKTRDILKSAGEAKTHQYITGFAAETNDIEKYAKEKLISKNLDMIVSNDISNAEIGFSTTDNEVVIYTKSGKEIFIPKKSKYKIARGILDIIAIDMMK